MTDCRLIAHAKGVHLLHTIHHKCTITRTEHEDTEDEDTSGDSQHSSIMLSLQSTRPRSLYSCIWPVISSADQIQRIQATSCRGGLGGGGGGGGADCDKDTTMNIEGSTDDSSDKK